MILSVGMPRAGSGWYYNLTKDLVIASGGIDGNRVRSRYRLQNLLTEVNCNLGTLSFYRLVPTLLPLLFENSYVIKLHAGRRPLADLVIRLGLIKPTFIYRDPRDALLSAYENGQKMSAQGLSNAFTPLKTVEDAIHFMEFYVDIARGWIELPGSLVVKYEDLKENYDEEAARLIRFLDLDPQDIKVNEIIDRYRSDKKPQPSKGLHFVKGEIGRHREVFDQDQMEICQRLFGDFLDENGYEI
jgi:hypothetical protein